MSDNSHAEILVVDDDAMSRRVLAQLLRAAGYECRVCKDGFEALDMVHEKTPTLLLLDFDMPGANGAEVLIRLRTDPQPGIAQIPTILLTAHGSEQSEVSCLQAGADEVEVRRPDQPLAGLGLAVHHLHEGGEITEQERLELLVG